ncbi:MAG: C2H2-type zinc finger protein [Thaumarchaeota archaeon]|nr:C2H2-type zinc finger protein [Nitrososphaerota archaeon]
MIIDCANDSELAAELGTYLKNHYIDVRIGDASVITTESNLEEIIKSFLEETKRSGYSLRKIDPTNILLAKEVPIENFGFFRCEMCGYVVSNEEELLTHRRAHGIQLL